MDDHPEPLDLHAPLVLGTQTLAGLWRAVLPEEAQWMKLPTERFADCSSCAPAQRGDYDPGCRCCAHLPHVPNVSLGLALERPETAAQVRRVLAQGVALPSGLWAGPAHFKREVTLQAEEAYGTDASMACPFFDAPTAACGIYAYRNSVCSSFFCEHDHGAAGEDLWSRLQAVLGSAETALQQWAMGQAGLSWAVQSARMAELTPRLTEISAGTGWTEEALRHIWGEWRGREELFYARCLAAVREHEDSLAETLGQWAVTDAVEFELAARDLLAPEHRHEAPPVATGTTERVPLAELWYSLQLELRNLWSLPLGETLRWAPGVSVTSAEPTLPVLGQTLHRVEGGARPYGLTEEELTLFGLFREGRALDARVLDSEAADAVSDPRGFLSECVRRELLVSE